jgi:toluene monooxygenase system ferredoxin subunit
MAVPTAEGRHDPYCVPRHQRARLLVNVDGTVRAYSNRCPHQASALDEGDLDGETLTCAKHLWEFNAVTGGGINPDDARLTSYDCQVGDDGTIYVDIGR